MFIREYCNNLITFYIIKNNFLKSAFLPNSPGCNTNTSDGLKYAENLHGFISNHTDFINEMKKGCSLGKNTTKCRIHNSDVNDILYEFNESYYYYMENPTTLCSSFAEFSNNEGGLLITGGCYLKNTTINHICYLYKDSPKEGFKCN